MRYVESKAESVAWSIYWYGSRRKQPFRDIYTGEMKKWERRNANFINNHDYYRYLRQNTDNN